MKILLLTGSPRRGGNSELMAEAFSKGAVEAGHTVFRFDAAFCEIAGCRACGQCFKLGRPCVIEDDFATMAQYFESAEAFVLCAPAYWSFFPANMKAALDRLHAYSSTAEGRSRMGIRESALLACAEANSEEIFTAMHFAYRDMVHYLGWKDRGAVLAPRVHGKGAIRGTPALAEAERLGASMGAD